MQARQSTFLCNIKERSGFWCNTRKNLSKSTSKWKRRFLNFYLRVTKLTIKPVVPVLLTDCSLEEKGRVIPVCRKG